MNKKLYGISESFGHALEWRGCRGGKMIKKDVCPALRATDYKLPKMVWYEIEDD